MANLIKCYNEDSVEFLRLKIFRDVANKILLQNNHGMQIKDIYFDFGQDWWYTALITKELSSGVSCQSFCPRDYELIVSCDSISKLMQMATYYAENIVKGLWDYKMSLYEKF